MAGPYLRMIVCNANLSVTASHGIGRSAMVFERKYCQLRAGADTQLITKLLLLDNNLHSTAENWDK
jgi:hypothetical protein